ncbi:paraneoplastic antigen Ma3 homolog [Saccostrea echinata]|uniref:paraneoplastic antigen Ma3 homolog n=1 Tax=Saccostrea echinata TaxID=191078 RepID=UPI002A7FFADF|nr:paraneoplastic antigen Ma3 homolog [Saccostrea echinata]
MADKEKQKVTADVSSSEENKLDFAGVAQPATSTPKTTKDGNPVKTEVSVPAEHLQSAKPKVSVPDHNVPLHLGQKHNPFAKLACNFGDTSSSGSKLQNTFYDKDGNSINQVYEFNTNIPRIPQFSGDDPPQKGDVSYKEWRFEVQCLMRDPDIKSNILIQSIRRSLRGTAKTMLIPLGEKAGVKQILEKLDILFGEISNNGMIMQEFFNAFQLPGECVTAFGCRLETMLQNAIDNGYLDRASKNDLLRHKFWTSLSSEKLKSQTRHKYDDIKNYDKLLLEIRRVEKEILISSSISEKKPVHQHGMSVSEDLEEKLMEKMRNMETKLEGKINDKFNQILEKLDGRTGNVASRPTENRGRGSYYRGRGVWRGNSNYYRGNSNDRRINAGRGQGQRRDQGKRTGNYNPNE